MSSEIIRSGICDIAFWNAKAWVFTGSRLPGVSLILRPFAMKLRVCSVIFGSVIVGILRELMILSNKILTF